MTISKIKRFHVSIKDQVKGPFEIKLIEAFILSGLYPEVIQICEEGSSAWRAYSISTTISQTPTALSKAAKPAALGTTGTPPTWFDFIKETWAPLLALSFLLFVFIQSSFLSSSARASTSVKHTPPPSTVSPTPTQYPAYTTAPARASAKYSSSGSTLNENLYLGSNGHTYSIPHADYQRLTAMKTALKSEELTVEAAKNNVKTLDARLKIQKAGLDRTSQIAIDSYNSEVRNYNAARDELNLKIDSFNSNVDNFNIELKRVGTLKN